MKRIFLDTNFIIDYLLREEYKLVSQNFLEEGDKRGYQFYISYLTIANFAYIARKLSTEVLERYLRSICKLFNVVSCDVNQILNAIDIGAKDFEDALQYQAAISANCEYIITRNAKDFAFSKIPVISAEELQSFYF